jgi:hypothetical protein
MTPAVPIWESAFFRSTLSDMRTPRFREEIAQRDTVLSYELADAVLIDLSSLRFMRVFRSFESVERYCSCLQVLNDSDVTTMTEDFLTGPKEYPSTITVAEIREQFVAMGLPCRIEYHPGEVWIVFEGRECNLVFTVNASGRPLSAFMPESPGYDAEFACVVFDVFDSVGWSFDE